MRALDKKKDGNSIRLGALGRAVPVLSKFLFSLFASSFPVHSKCHGQGRVRRRKSFFFFDLPR